MTSSQDPQNNQGSGTRTIEVDPIPVSRPSTGVLEYRNPDLIGVKGDQDKLQTSKPPQTDEEKIEALTTEIHGMPSQTSQLTGVEALGQTSKDNPETGLNKADLLALATRKS